MLGITPNSSRECATMWICETCHESFTHWNPNGDPPPACPLCGVKFSHVAGPTGPTKIDF